MKEKAAQLIVPRLDGGRLGDEEYLNQILKLLDAGIGGFILFGGSIPETPEAIMRLQERARIPLLITSDIERGLGQQITGGTRFPNQWAVAEAINPEEAGDIYLLHQMLKAVREECIAAGIHAVFSPVADVNVNPDNPIICTRSFGEDPERVSWFVKEYVRGLQEQESEVRSQKSEVASHISRLTSHFLSACAKHFPGHGDTAVDSHTSLPIINADRERLERVEFTPFRAAIDAGVGMIMIGHLQVPALEPEPIPATFSKKIVTELLREEMGFRGLIVTDAMDMGALKAICDEGEAAVRCLEAGCDILLHPSEPLKMLEAIVKAVDDGRLPSSRVDEAYKRVTGIKGQKSEVKSQKSREFYSALRTPHSALAYKLALKAVKFRKGRGVTPSENIVCMVIDDDGDGNVAVPFLNDMKSRVPEFKTVSSPSEIKQDEMVVIPIFSRVSAWKGSSGLSEDSFEKVKSIIDRAGRSVLISFGSPYILNSFDADVMIDAFDPADFMQRAVVERLVTG